MDSPVGRDAVRVVLGSSALATLLAALISGTVVAGRAIMGPWHHAAYALDYSAAVWVRSLRSPAMDLLMGSLSWIGEMVPMAIITAGIFITLLLCGRRRSALCAALSLPGTAIMWKFTSTLVWRERPNYWILHEAADIGYPCGHLMNAVVVAGFCLFAAGTRPRSRARWTAMVSFWLLLVVGTGLARIYVNAHYLTDDIAGFLMGLIWIVLALPILRWTFPGCPDTARAPGAFRASQFAGRASGLSRGMAEQWRRRGIAAIAKRGGREAVARPKRPHDRPGREANHRGPGYRSPWRVRAGDTRLAVTPRR